MGEICVRVPGWMPELIDVLVKGGFFKTRSEFVGFAIGLTLYGYRAVLEDTWGVRVLIGSPGSSSEKGKKAIGILD